MIQFPFYKIRNKINLIKNKLLRKILERFLISFVISISIHFIFYIKNSIVVRSIPKSGTQYLRLLITNYLVNYDSNLFKEINYFEMHNNYFPNIRNRIFWKQDQLKNNYLQKNILRNKYSDFIYDHGCVTDRIKFFRPKKMILLYRNPLDHLISLFNYKIKQKATILHPNELIEKNLVEFVKNYLFIKTNKNNPNVSILTYEELIENPKNVLLRLIDFLDLPLNKKIIPNVINSCSIDNVKKSEIIYEAPIHLEKSNEKQSFISSGNIGQWKKYFDNNDILLIKKILKTYNVSLDEFKISID